MASSVFNGAAISKLYQQYRPTYPHEFYERILSNIALKLSPPHEQAVDVGCGSGQATLALASHFSNVTGIDISQSQIAEAKAHCKADNVTFKVGSFDALPFPSSSCALVLCMAAAHWFDPLSAFYQEADRVLKPGGCLVVASYGREILTFEDGRRVKDLTPIFRQFHDDSLIQNRMKQCHRESENKYAGWRLICGDQRRFDDMQITRKMSVDQFIGLQMSKSFVYHDGLYRLDIDHPLHMLKKRLLEVTNQTSASDEVKIIVATQLFGLLGRKPSC